MIKRSSPPLDTVGQGHLRVGFSDSIIQDIGHARFYLRALAKALLEGAHSPDPRVTAAAIALLRYQACNLPEGRQ